MNGDYGFLWQMDTKFDLETNVLKALMHHYQEFGSKATVVNVNPDDLAEAMVIEGIRVMPEKSCLKGCLFVGRKVEEK